MTDLRLDLSALHALHNQLSELSDVFAAADQFSADTVGPAVGSSDMVPRLRGSITKFSTSWNDNRKKIRGNMMKLADAAEAISESFRELDEHLAREASKLGDMKLQAF